MDINDVVILDFETTGLTASVQRVIEVGAVRVDNGKITKRFTQLCCPGINIPYYITDLTGITDEMVEDKPKPEQVMPELQSFIGRRPIIAHNAKFDQEFLYMEMRRARLYVNNPIFCTLKLSRAMIQDSENHKLETLKSYLGYQPPDENAMAHRALHDAEATATLWLYLKNKLLKLVGEDKLNIALLQKLNRMSHAKAVIFLSKFDVQLDIESKRSEVLQT